MYILFYGIRLLFSFSSFFVLYANNFKERWCTFIKTSWISDIDVIKLEICCFFFILEYNWVESKFVYFIWVMLPLAATPISSAQEKIHTEEKSKTLTKRHCLVRLNVFLVNKVPFYWMSIQFTAREHTHLLDFFFSVHTHKHTDINRNI